MRILLIEDELPAARQLTRLIQAQRPSYAILETLDSVSSAGLRCQVVGILQ